MIRKFLSHLHKILSQFIFMSKNLNSWPLAYSLIGLNLIKNIRCNSQIIPKYIEFFRITCSIFIIKYTLLIICKCLIAILIYIYNLIKIHIINVLWSWIIKHWLNMSYFEAKIFCSLYNNFILCVESVYNQFRWWIKISYLKIIRSWFLIFNMNFSLFSFFCRFLLIDNL
jgi:hypothetical protein